MIRLHFVQHFIKHYWSATRIDVLHSPFVFKLYNTCIKRQPTQPELAPIEAIRKKAVSNQQLVSQHDFGARRAERKVATRPISHFAKHHAKPARISQIIFHLIKNYGYKNCIELGTSLGFTSMHIAKALQQGGQLTTIEGAHEIAAAAEQHFITTETQNNIKQVIGNFDTALPDVLNRHEQVDFAFVDGNHTYEATNQYFNLLLSKAHYNSLIIIDDIYWSPEMTRAWREIQQHERVTVTVDLFYIGLVYFRKKQAKEHFKLRIL